MQVYSVLDKPDLAGMVFHKWVPTYRIYFYPKILPKPSTRIWLTALMNVPLTLAESLIQAMNSFMGDLPKSD